MKQKICFLTIGALLFSSLGSTNVVGAENSCPQNIFISEVGWAGSSKSAADEWLELANAGETAVDLSNWIIEGAGTSGSSLTLPGGALIPSRSTYLIANYNAESGSSVLAAPPNYINTAVSLSNSTLHLILKDQNGCQLDEIGDGGAPFFGGTGIGGTISMVRLEPLANGVLSTSWIAAETSEGFDSGVSDKGTPGNIKWIFLFSSVAEEVTSVETSVEETSDPPPPQSSPTALQETSGRPEESKAAAVREEETVETTVIDETVSETPDVTDKTLVESEETLADETTAEETTEVNPPPQSSPAALQLDSGRPELFDWPQSSLSESRREESKAVATGEEESTEIIEEIIEETTTPTVISYPKSMLLINEFVSDPISGEKEWVEVINPNDTTVSLAGWKISESSGRTAALPDIQLSYGQVAVAEFSSSALNNDGDTITIIAPDGTVVDEIVYGSNSIPAAADPYSVARGAEGNFVVTETPTKGKMNIITTTITVTKTEVCKTSSKASDDKKTVAATEDETASTKTVVVETTPPTLRLSELYPNTGGADTTDEFIELQNFGSETIDLFGLTLQDATENNWSFPDHRELPAGKFLAISRTEYKFALNNSGSETVELYSAGGTLLDQTQYENAPKNFTYARDNELWSWTSIITRDEPNSFPTTVESEDSGLVRPADADLAVEGTDAPEPIVSVTIAEARTLAKDSQATVTGIVSVAPNIFGRQIFYLTDNVAGIQIYKSDGIFPELMIGDAVEISGTTSSNRGEPRIKIGQDDEITVIESEVTLDVADTETISKAEAGQLVRLAGLVTEKSSGQFTIETAGGLSEVRIKENTGIDLSKLEPGGNVTIKGIVGQSEEKYFLLPRSSDDLTVETKEETAAPVVSTEPTGKQVAAKTDQKKAIIIGLAVITGLVIYAIKKRRGLKTKSYEKTSKLSFAGAG